MKRFLSTAVLCLSLVPTVAYTSYTIFPDGTLMTEVREFQHPVTPKPFTSCNGPLAGWFKLNTLTVNNLSTLSPVHIRTVGICDSADGAVITGHMYDLYGTSPPNITVEFKDEYYLLVWQVQSNVGGTWSPAGTFTLIVPFADIH